MSLPDNSYEESIVARCSTPGLKRSLLSRYSKKEQLDSLKVPLEETKRILDQLFPTPTESAS